MESGIKDKFNLLVLGSKLPAKEIEFNPPPTQVLSAGMTLIVMGDVEKIAEAKETF
jgi:hypothetical protein